MTLSPTTEAIKVKSCEKNLNSEIREMHLEKNDYIFMAKINKELKEYDDNLNKIK